MPVFLIPVALQFLAALPGLIGAAEKAFSGKPGSGAHKKKFVSRAAGAALDAAQATGQVNLSPAQRKALLSAVDGLTDATVKSLNAAQVFTKEKGA
jgi:hypothetical protein